MSEQQCQTTTPATGQDDGPDDREPTPERQAELRAAYEANAAAGRAPYAGVPISTRGVLLWVMRERGWSGEFEMPEGDERANLRGATLALANLSGATLFGTDLSGADLRGANLRGATLALANLSAADLRRSRLHEADLFGADLRGADLRGANLRGTHFAGADLRQATLNDADLSGAHLAGTNLSGAALHSARMDTTTDLRGALLDTYTLLADVVWNGVNLTRLNWQDVAMLGKEQLARDPKWHTGERSGERKPESIRLFEYADAVRANRQVATVLRSQGLNEHGDRFAFRAQLCQRRLLRLQRHYLRYLGSLFLGLTAGYGYRPLRSFIAYALVILGFAAAYVFIAGQAGVAMPPLAALAFSVTSFHGRGFMAGENVPLTNPLMVLAAGEAIIGLLIEITFIVTFTQRFVAR